MGYELHICQQCKKMDQAEMTELGAAALPHPGGLLSIGLGSWFGVGLGRSIAVLFFGIGIVKAISVRWIFAAPGTRQLDHELSAKPAPSHSHLN